MVQTPVDFIGFDRRFIGQGLYLDSLAGEKVRIMIAVDTSGSIGQNEISLFLGEVQGILRAYPHLEASLYYADAACYGPYELEPDGTLPAPVGGGGTDFRPFFHAVSSEDTASLCIYLTDGFGTFPTDPPSLPVLWVLSPGGLNLQQVPFGETVRLLPS
jgi:predicted metal-dependent peptidase